MYSDRVLADLKRIGRIEEDRYHAVLAAENNIECKDVAWWTVDPKFKTGLISSFSPQLHEKINYLVTCGAVRRDVNDSIILEYVPQPVTL